MLKFSHLKYQKGVWVCGNNFPIDYLMAFLYLDNNKIWRKGVEKKREKTCQNEWAISWVFIKIYCCLCNLSQSYAALYQIEFSYCIVIKKIINYPFQHFCLLFFLKNDRKQKSIRKNALSPMFRFLIKHCSKPLCIMWWSVFCIVKMKST